MSSEIQSAERAHYVIKLDLDDTAPAIFELRNSGKDCLIRIEKNVIECGASVRPCGSRAGVNAERCEDGCDRRNKSRRSVWKVWFGTFGAQHAWLRFGV
jgi:hypothetical protein